jgi:hypothetical protein
LFSEAPVGDIARMGDWEEKSKRKYDEPSIKLLKKDSYLQKLKSEFAKDIAINFNLYFLKSKNASKYSEYGIITENELRSLITDIDVDPIIKSSNNSNLTIIFTNNVGIDKVPLTPWMIGHRIGHVLYRGGFKDSVLKREWDMFLSEYKNSMNSCFDIKDITGNRGDRNETKKIKKVLNGLGTFRSARENKIDRPFEFIYEVFSQFLSTGEITFNDIMNDEQCVYYIQSIFESGISNILSSSLGKIFLM